MSESVILLLTSTPSHLDPASATFYLSKWRPRGRRPSWDTMFLFWSRAHHDDLANRWLDHLTSFYFKQNVPVRLMLSDSSLLPGSLG